MTEQDLADAHLVNAALDIHADDPAFGYRYLPTNSSRMASQRARTESSACAGIPGPPVGDDLVDRAFTAAAPN
ncbi:hypothetical protein J2T11_000123 [Paenarthrobacter nicotinovorans]|nr:hypothetical protein [Paenarthrobacter nicotinovorans]